MENNLQQVFNYGNLQVRTTVIEGQLWFVAKDVCAILDFSVHNTAQHLKRIPTEMKGINSINTIKGKQKVYHVNEAGLNMLIMRSNKPEAVKFQQWIASDVLPSIRRHGMYLTPEVAKEAADSPDVFLARAVLVAQEVIEKQKATIAHQAETIAQLEPKAKQYDRVMNAESTYTVSDVAFFNDMVSSRLFTLLRNIGWLDKRGNSANHVTKRAPEGVFKVIKTMFGEQIRVTIKGKQAIDDLIKEVKGA